MISCCCNGEQDSTLLPSLVCGPAAASPWVMWQKMTLARGVCIGVAGVKNQWAPVVNGIGPVGGPCLCVFVCVCVCVCVCAYSTSQMSRKVIEKREWCGAGVCVSWWKMMTEGGCGVHTEVYPGRINAVIDWLTVISPCPFWGVITEGE